MRSFFGWAKSLRFKQLFLLALFLFIADLMIPDVIPLIDELLLGLMTLLLGSIRKKTDDKKNRKSID